MFMLKFVSNNQCYYFFLLFAGYTVDDLIAFMTECGVKDGIAILERHNQKGSLNSICCLFVLLSYVSIKQIYDRITL